MSSTIEYEALSQALGRAGAEVGASESHGLLCGLLCGQPNGAKDVWMKHVLEDVASGDVLAKECRTQLEQLYAETQAALNGVGIELDLLMPDDDEPLIERGEALGDWIQGYLFGFGLSGKKEADLPTDSQELIQDMTEIARLGVSEDADEEEEDAFIQIVEYLRAGVLLINEELNPVKAPPRLQ